MTDPTDSVLRDWLLHRLPDDRTDTLEQSLMLDDGIAARVQDAEHDLIDDYARGRLDSDDRIAVERYLLRTPGDLQRLQLAQALARITTQRSTQDAAGSDAPRTTPSTRMTRPRRQASPPQRRWYGAVGGALAAAILLAAAFSWRSTHEGSPAPEFSLHHPTGSVIANVTLLADTERGAGSTPAVTIPSRADAVRLQVEVEQPQVAAVYELSIAGAGGTPFVARNLGLRRSGPYAFVETVLPVRVLAPGLLRISLAQKGSSQAPAQWTVRFVRSD